MAVTQKPKLVTLDPHEEYPVGVLQDFSASSSGHFAGRSSKSQAHTAATDE